MRLVLRPHPESQCDTATGVEVEVAHASAHNLSLRYLVWGDISALRLPPPAAPKRADELWRHTCFEAFVCTPPSCAYYEFNFAPSKEWAAYQFEEYRRGMHSENVPTPQIDIRASSDCYELKILLELGSLAGLQSVASWRLGLSAVLEEGSGNKSYWALEHPPGQPDFHRSECFTHEIVRS